MTPTDHLVERLVSQQLADNPRSRSLYNTDAMFHASVDLFRTTLQAVAEEMWDAVVPPWQIEKVVKATLGRMLSDQVMDQNDELVKIATRPLWNKLVTEQQNRLG